MQKYPTLIFLHIPKTAGRTFSSIVAGLYRQRHTYSIYSLETINHLTQLPEAERAKIDFLQGHVPFGIHQYIPRPVQYITFLRDPVERVLSLYYFILRTPTHYLHTTVVSKQISLEEFVHSSPTSEIHNFQVRMIAGVDGLDSDVFPHLDSEHLAIAKQRLVSDFEAFGITERFDESLVLFHRLLGWRLLFRALFYRNGNVAPERKSTDEVPADVIAEIRQKNQLDIGLYDYACELFNSRIKEGGNDFQKRYHRLQSWRQLWTR